MPHEISWQGLKAIDRAHWKRKRKIREAFHIQKRKLQLNRDVGVAQSAIWNAIIWFCVGLDTTLWWDCLPVRCATIRSGQTPSRRGCSQSRTQAIMPLGPIGLGLGPMSHCYHKLVYLRWTKHLVSPCSLFVCMFVVFYFYFLLYFYSIFYFLSL